MQQNPSKGGFGARQGSSQVSLKSVEQFALLETVKAAGLLVSDTTDHRVSAWLFPGFAGFLLFVNSSQKLTSSC